jgi:hypothetical protein
MPCPAERGDQHSAQIRQHSGWRPPTGGDKVVLEVRPRSYRPTVPTVALQARAYQPVTICSISNDLLHDSIQRSISRLNQQPGPRFRGFLTNHGLPLRGRAGCINLISLQCLTATLQLFAPEPALAHQQLDPAAMNVSASHPGFDSRYPSLHPETQESVGCHHRHRERNDSVHVAARNL